MAENTRALTGLIPLYKVVGPSQEAIWKSLKLVFPQTYQLSFIAEVWLTGKFHLLPLEGWLEDFAWEKQVIKQIVPVLFLEKLTSFTKDVEKIKPKCTLKTSEIVVKGKWEIGRLIGNTGWIVIGIPVWSEDG